MVPQLAMGESVGRETIDDAECVAELVVESRPDNAYRKSMAHVADTLADVIPDVGDFARGRFALQIDEDCRDAGCGIAAQEIQLRRLLQRALEALGHLIQSVFHRRAGPCGLNHHRLDDEGWIFTAAQAQIRHDSVDHRDDHEIDDKRSVFERPLRKVEPHHDSDPSSRTFCPGWRAWTPAVTTISPVSSPWETAAVAWSKRNTSTLRIDTVWLDGSTIQTAACWFALVKAVAGISMVGVESVCIVPLTVAPSRLASGGSVKPTFTSKVRVCGLAWGA